MSLFSEMVTFLESMDIFSLFFPWLLVLALTFGILKKYEYFEDDSVTGAVAVSVAFITVGGLSLLPEALLVNIGAVVALSAFIVVGFLIIMGVAGVESEGLGEDSTPLKIGLAVLGVGLAAVLWTSLGIGEMVGSLESDGQLVNQIIVFVFILAIVALTAN